MGFSFKSTAISSLYQGTDTAAWSGYLLPRDLTITESEISLGDSLNKYKGIYLFSAAKPKINATFIRSIWAFLDQTTAPSKFSGRCFLWLNGKGNPDSGPALAQMILFEETSYISISQVKGDSQRLWINNITRFAFAPYSKVQVKNDTISIQRMAASADKYDYGMDLFNANNGTRVRLGKIATDASRPKEPPVIIPFTGPTSGCVQFELSFPFNFKNPSYFKIGYDSYPYHKSRDMYDDYAILDSGFRYYYPSAKSDTEYIELQYKLFTPDTSCDFRGSIDFCDIFNPARTYFAFKTAPVLDTTFRTNYGKNIVLKPQLPSDGGQEKSGRIVFTKSPSGKQENPSRYYWAPEGAFNLIANDTPATAEHPAMFLCGASGTETVSFSPQTGEYNGDLIVFNSLKPAVASNFPILNSEGKKVQELLSGPFTASWANFRHSENIAANYYFSQPADAPLFRKGDIPVLLNAAQTPSADLAVISHDQGFPLAPTSTVHPSASLSVPNKPAPYTADDLLQFEVQILNPSRKLIIAEANKPVPIKKKKRGAKKAMFLSEDPCPITNLMTTPQGFLVNLNEDSTQWKCLTLANNEPGASIADPLRFTGLDTPEGKATGLQNAFQTNEQFLVISDPSTLNDDVLEYYKTNFQDKIDICHWPFLLDIAQQNKTSNTSSRFRNILIFKFCNYSIKERIQNLSMWTDPATFNQNDTLPELQKWILDYIKTAEKTLSTESGVQDAGGAGEREGLQNFVDIVNNSSWNGVLALQVTLDLKTMPQEIQCILAGINTSRFAAHHFGIETNQISMNENGELNPNFKSSLFGMISYFNETYLSYLNGSATIPEPLPQTAGNFDFKVLELQVVFRNSQIVDFNAKAQLNLNSLFQELVIKEGNAGQLAVNRNSIILDGQYDKKNGTTSYTFAVRQSNELSLESTAIQKVNVTGVQLSTVDSGSDKETKTLLTTRFNISGSLAFHALKHFDMFSYDQLDFTNLILDMEFDLSDTNTPDKTPRKQFSLLPAGLIFQKGKTITRDGSLVPHFPIELDTFVFNTPVKDTAKVTPASLGFMAVEAPLATAPVGETWYALKYKLNLGSMGALAAKAGFNAEVMLAWSPGSQNKAQVFTKMPFSGGGTGGGFSIQGVLKFQIGSIFFFNTPAEDGNSQYSMAFSKVGVSILGKKLPPSGSTVLYLFGNPKGNDVTSENGNLGWFGAYMKDKKTTKAIRTRAKQINSNQLK